jgi:hypothetical protein
MMNPSLPLTLRSCSFSVALCFVLAAQARAELPHIRLDRIFPLGGGAGTQVAVEIAGRDLDEVKALRFDHPGPRAEWLKPNQFRVTIAADTPPGSYEIRAVGKYGISGALLFAVSRGLTEIQEKPGIDTPEKAQAVPLNCVINGKSDGNGDDFFRFHAARGTRVILDCQAFRLNSTLRGSLTLFAPDGKQLLQSRPYYHRSDPLLDFVAAADGDYLVSLHDATYLGGLPYRLVISTRPHVENAFPAAVVPGETTELTLLGRNLPGGKLAGEWTVQDRPLEQLRVSFTAPKDALRQRRFAVTHLPSPSLNARTLQFCPEPLQDALASVTVLCADAPVVCEREPNDTPESAQDVTLPAVVCGRLDRPGDRDWYAFTAKAGEPIAVDLLCERLDLPGDPFVLILDAKGKEVAAFDDHGINFNALAQFNRDPLGTFRAPADGRYRLVVQDRYRNGGARYQYVLRLAKAVPDFYPVVVHETPNEPTCPVVRQGSSAHYELCLNRRDYNGPVTVETEGLPPGVSCPAVHVSPQGQFANVVFTAAPDAPEWSGAVRLKAWAVIGGKRVEREVRGCQRRWPVANINTSVAVREICLAVRARAPYGIRLPAERSAVAAGGTLEAKVTVARHWAGFKGKVQLSGLNLPPGFRVAATEVPAGKTEATVKLTVAANVPPGEYSVVLRGDAQVPFNRDPAATNRPLVRVADPSTPWTVTVTAPRKK